MGWQAITRNISILSVCAVLAGCGGVNFGEVDEPDQFNEDVNTERTLTSSIFDLFTNVDDPNVTVEVNRYIWNASLDVLNFMPVESVDPFTGVIVMGYGTPPGGRRAYRATVYVRDPALDARSLTVAMQSRGGSVNVDTIRAIEDAILTRARQLRIADGKL